MKEQNTLYFLLTAFIATILTSCEPEELSNPSNPLNGRTTAVFNPDKKYGTMTDIDGNIYKTIVIGEQTWMAENLRVTHYRNGVEIPNIIDNDEWGTLTTGAYCNYNNTQDLDTIATYGRLYNWYAVADTQQLAPKGWRVPGIADWLELIEYLGGDSIASKHLKEVGTSHWVDDFDTDNSSGFTAIPNGHRYLAEDYSGIGSFSVLWTASNYSTDKSGFLYLYDFDSNIWKGVNYKLNGYSVRLIKGT
ncbi:MAG: fibrobacter succinogenes major paralogous domain-containing protein [Bacteroidota bacterium]